MALSTFTELKASIADFLNRSDLTSVIPDFITLAEDELNLRLNHWRGEKRSTASTDGQYLDLPDDWLETTRISITGDTTYELEVASQADIMERRAESNDTAGRPQFYCVTGGQIEFYPTPDDTYTVELVYRAAVDELSDANTSNWILTNYTNAYLYTALKNSAPYLVDDARLVVWQSLSEQAIAAINKDNAAKYSGSGLRIKIRSY